MTEYVIYSTGEASEMIGKSRQHIKKLAQSNGIHPAKVGKRGDWLWRPSEVEAIKKLVEAGVAK